MQFDTIEVTKYRQNCSILYCEESRAAAIIDPGGDLYLILDLLEWQELTLDVILVTHGHFDHCGGAAELAIKTGARIEGPHRGDARLVEQLAAQSGKNGVRSQPFVPARWLEHGDVVQLGKERINVLHCPGHTQGHVAYFHAGARQAFVGDILFRGTIGAWEHRDGNLPQLIDSIRNRLFVLGDDIQFVPGHGESSTFGRERQENPFVGDKAYALWQARRLSLSDTVGSDPHYDS